MSEELIDADGVSLCYETFGDPQDRPLLLVMGLGVQLISWEPEFCEAFADRGFYVIRYDHRDAGRSASFEGQEYSLSDMASDGMALLTALGIERAHVVGVSMGGMVSQTMAIRRPDRVLSLASVMSTTGERRQSRPKLRLWSLLLQRAPQRRDQYIEYFVRGFRMIGSPGYPTDEARLRELAGATYDRGHHPAGTGRQLAAIMASGDRTEQLRRLTVPTVVIHGTDDPLVPFRGGVATARAIPNSQFLAIPGMGHDLPREVWPKIVDAVVANAARAGAAQPA